MKVMAAAAAALAIPLLAGTPGQAQQLGELRGAAESRSALQLIQERGDRGDRGGDRDRGERRGDRDGRRDWDRRRGGGFNLYIGPGVGVYGGSAYGNCGWLRRRALDTGSNYWWNRYRRCRGWR